MTKTNVGFPKRFKIKLTNTKYVKGQPGVKELSLEVRAMTRGEAQNKCLAYAKKSLGDDYVLHKSEIGKSDEHPIKYDFVNGSLTRVN